MADRSRKASCHVVIIGAGIAGLSAAAHLVTNGFQNVTVLEATDRIGGRMCTAEFGGDRKIVELGANWIHGAAMNNSIFRLASEHKLLDPYVLLKRIQGYVYTSDGHAVGSDVTSKLFELFLQWEDEEGSATETDINQLSMDSETYFRNRLKEALPQFNESDYEAVECVFNVLINYEQFHRGDYLHTAASVDTGYVEIPGGNVKVPKGMISILNTLYEQLPPGTVKLRQPVCKITRKYDVVEISCTSGDSYTADHVICTCSLGFLKANHMNMFQPPLPAEKQLAIEQIGFGRVNKIFLRYKKPFWPEGKGGVYLGWKNSELDDKIKKWYKNVFGFDEVLNNPNVLVAWLSGQGAEDMERLSDEEVKQTCTEVLRQFLKDPSVPFPQDILRSKWVSNPFTLGSYSYWNFQTQQKSHQNLVEAVCNSSNSPLICFAGEATNAEFYSTMHGARSSGLREAERLLHYFSKSSKEEFTSRL